MRVRLSRPQMGGERAHARWLLAAVLAVSLTGCGSNSSSGRLLRVAGSFDSAKVVSSASCSASGTQAKTVYHQCVFVLGDGKRFSCPPAFARLVQNADSLEHAKACHRLSPLVIPAAWRPALAALQKTGSCIAKHGVRVSGGPSLGMRSGPDGPLGELLIVNRPGQVFIAFYKDNRTAQRSEPAAIQSAKHFHGDAVRQGSVIILWTRSPNDEVKVAKACVPPSASGS